MANLTEISEFTAGIHQIEVNEPVLGGPEGNTNVPLKQLANRTLFLKNAIDALEAGGGPFDFSAASGVPPQLGTDGAGTAGVKRKDLYWVTVGGTVNGTALQPGDQLIAKIDDADHISEYIVLQSNLDLATPTIMGLVKLVQNIAGGAATDAVLSVAGLINIFAQLASPALTGNPTTPDQAQGVSDQRIANRKHVVDAVAAEATARVNADNTEATNRINADNAEITNRANADTTLQNNINTEITNRQNADTTLQNNINNEATNRANADNTLQNNINNEATARVNGDNAVAALIPVFHNLGAPVNVPRVDGANDRNISNSDFAGMKIGFWCRFTLNAVNAGDVGVLSLRSASICGGNNILRQVDTGYSTQTKNSEHSWFVPCPPGVTVTFSIGHYIGSTAYADVVITCYV
jgi:hypothetical protein